ncbi:macro domain-containing protein [Oribacterium sp. WCC10]|uniref:macro domain-containing protein n=1 Tax=Oribacterium sp. WCC10 TaxID=1855343 RepID=UPI0008E0F0D1|nr:macro domain-containing protein [Oribacterium sp. WCC10]SFG70497.1 Macro domain-containing protein [Oribacterium sp. WCC10]
MSSIKIKKTSITKLDTDAIVNAANEGLWEGGGVCGAIFREAGSDKLTKACNDFIKDNPDYDINIIFAVLDDKILDVGEKTIKEFV